MTERTPKKEQTSPITIGGGSVYIDFDETYYQLVPGTDTYSNAKDSILTIWLLNANGKYMRDPALHKAVSGTDCEVTIRTMIGGSSESDVVIRSRPGGPLSVTFLDKDFPPDRDLAMRSNSQRDLPVSLEVFDNNTHKSTTFRVPDKKGRIHVVNAL